MTSRFTWKMYCYIVNATCYNEAYAEMVLNELLKEALYQGEY